MSDNDLIRRGDALALPPYDGDGDPAGQWDHHVFVRRDAIAALPAVTPALVLKHIGTGLYETQSDYRLAPHLQRIVDAAKSAPQWDMQADRLAPTDAPHVNETPKSEHDGADVLTAAQAPAEDAHVKGETAGQMLERLGMDGAKWAAEFRTTALRLGYSDMDEGWLIGWFCNAIMAGYDRSAAQAREAALLEAWNVVWEAKTLLDAKNALHALIGEARK